MDSITNKSEPYTSYRLSSQLSKQLFIKTNEVFFKPYGLLFQMS